MFKNLKEKLTKAFLFLKESEIVQEVLEVLNPVIKDNYKHLKNLVAEYIKYKSTKVKETIITFIMDKVSLPWYLKPFKNKVKKALDKNFDKIVEFLLKKLG